MANATFDRKEFEKTVKLTDEVKEKITLFGTPLEAVTDEHIEIEVFPNRPDLLSLQGFLRSFKPFLGKDVGMPTYKVHKPETNYTVTIESSVKEIRPFTACAIIKEISFNNEKIKEIIDLQEKLHMTIGRNRKKVAIGVYPLDKISLPIRYLAKKPEEISFIPLESEREMSGKQILQRHPTGIKYAHLLEEYQKYPLFIDSKGKVLSMPPIINSSETGRVTEETHDVFVECSGWHFETLQKTLSILVTSLADMGGKIYGVEIINGKEKTLSPDLTPGKMSISIERINKILGLELKEKDFSQLLPKMGYEYSAGKIKIPSWRVDVLHEVDVAEDVAIAYGYDKFIPHIPEVSTIGEESFSSTLSRKIGEALSGLGLLEISTYHLLKIEEAQQLKKEELLIVENSKTEYKVLRPNLFIPGLRILSENKDREYPQCLYEIGTVFLKDDSGMSETGVCEEEHLFIAGSPKNFTDMKQYLNYLATSLGVTFTLKEGDHSGLIEGRVADIYIQDRYAGYFGEVHPETLRTWGLKMPLVILELNLKDIQKLLDKSDLQ